MAKNVIHDPGPSSVEIHPMPSLVACTIPDNSLIPKGRPRNFSLSSLKRCPSLDCEAPGRHDTWQSNTQGHDLISSFVNSYLSKQAAPAIGAMILSGGLLGGSFSKSGMKTESMMESPSFGCKALDAHVGHDG